MTFRNAVQATPAGFAPALPAWVPTLFEEEVGAWSRINSWLHVRAQEKGGHALISLRLEGLLDESREICSQRCAAAYDYLFQRLSSLEAKHPIRLWNFLPGILAPLGQLPHRYMAFNAGRFEAFRRWRNGNLCASIPTATAVGQDGDDLFIHCLAAEKPGKPVENPRQISSYRYSERYGPLPPCFARATLIDTDRAGADSVLLVGGTASVLGEDSVHLSDVREQIRETFLNLATLIRSAADSKTAAAEPVEGGGGDREDDSGELEIGFLLSRYHRLRVYYRYPSDLPIISEQVETKFSNVESVEFVRADLCRPELLVEIEGVASIPPAKS